MCLPQKINKKCVAASKTFEFPLEDVNYSGSAGEAMEKMELLGTVGGSVNQGSHYGKQ